jgi:tape measure domain-containing protein
VAVVAAVQIKVDASSAKAQISGLQASTTKLQGAFGKLRAAGSSLQGVLAGIGAGALLKGFVSAGIEAQRTTKRLKLLSKQYGESAQLAQIADQAASKYAIGNTQAANAVADLYGRLRPMGISLEDIGTTFNAVNTAAAKMNLTAYETDGVLLQLSQALGSGTLQGDEFRSVMERLPAIGQAVANSMGVSVGELKKLGSEGKLTTDVIIKALQGLANEKAPEPDPYKKFQAALSDLSTTIGQELLPAFTPLVEFAGSLARAFGSLPGPVKTTLAALIALAGAAAILAPLVSVIASIGPALTGVIGAVSAVAGALTGGGGLLAAIGAVFSGPVGWVALLVGAGVALYAFRDQIATVFEAIGIVIKYAWETFKSVYVDPIINAGKMIYQFFKENWGAISEFVSGVFTKIFEFYKTTFIDPVVNLARSLIETFGNIFNSIGEAIKAPFVAAFNAIKGVVNSVLSGIANAINGVVNAINRVIRAANSAAAKVGLPQIPLIPKVSVPQFAEGGVVTGPTLAMVGEGGEPEYIIPQSKAAGFASNYLSGQRGAGAIPAFADGGYVAPSSANVNIQTGPVTQMDGTNYVTTKDLGRAVQAGVNQTLDLIRRDGNTRAALGLS